MYLAHLSLVNFRNYARLEMALEPGITVVLGDNAQGKSNLLEAIYFLATTKSFRSGADRELINWLAGADADSQAFGISFARIAARVQREEELVRLELVIKEEQRGETGGQAPSGMASSTTKQLRINGVPKRAIDVIGRANVVMFSPQDIELVTGAPQLRRRYLDVTISQVDPRYVRTLAHYNKVLAQRNHLLRQIKEGQASPDHLSFWDQELSAAGGYLVVQRRRAVAELNRFVRERHGALTESGERLQIAHRSSTNGGSADSAEYREADDLEAAVAAQIAAYREQLVQQQPREIAYGMSLVGPHRDDLGFVVDDRDVAIYGSRGQQRTVVLSLKLAEAAFIRDRSGEEPIVLLDDVMSELDRERGHRVLAALSPLPQVLITATDRQHFEAEFLAQATLLRVRQGLIGPDS